MTSKTSLTSNHIVWPKGVLALSPVIVFLITYLVVSLVIDDFYRMPIAVSLLLASIWGVMISNGISLTKRIEIFSQSAGQSNILYMIWIFVLAGAFASLAKAIGSIDATVNLTLKAFPIEYVVPGLFTAACFISLSIGTSVGTVVALTPLAVELADVCGGNIPFFVAAVLGGAFFGDNLSFISDTTIAATRLQGCDMSDKFKANLFIVVPAALMALAGYVFMGPDISEVSMNDQSDWILVFPYILIIVLAILGVNVTIVLSIGTALAFMIGIIRGYDVIDMAGYMGEGIDSMGNLIIVTALAAGMLGLVKYNGGIRFLLQCITRNVCGTRGAQSAIALLVAVVNLCTANNTVAIITVGSISREISEKFGIDPRKSASLLDTCSCIVQCLIPYGAQALLATSLAGISPVAPFRYLFYPWALILMVVLSIIFQFPSHLQKK